MRSVLVGTAVRVFMIRNLDEVESDLVAIGEPVLLATLVRVDLEPERRIMIERPSDVLDREDRACLLYTSRCV